MTETDFRKRVVNRIVCGDCLDVMQDWPDSCVDLCVTSPPYWGLRDYGVEGQLGLEETPQEYIENMVAVFREVYRVLADHGTLWLNMGSSYAAGGHNERSGDRQPKKAPPGFKPKDLVPVPWMLAMALQADGWYLRSDIIWHKPNPMPESCRDRPTKAHDDLFLLSKKPRYFYDAEAIKEQGSPNTHSRGKAGTGPDSAEITYKSDQFGSGNRNNKDFQRYMGDRLIGTPRNKRSVWTIPTQATPEAHVATFPEKLVEPCILAGTSAKGYCPNCGKPWNKEKGLEKGVCRDNAFNKLPASERKAEYTTLGWRPTCDCGNDDVLRPGIVLDPFGGSGTVGVVAGRLKRDYVLIELSEAYAENIARPRLAGMETGVPVAERRAGQGGLFDEDHGVAATGDGINAKG